EGLVVGVADGVVDLRAPLPDLVALGDVDDGGRLGEPQAHLPEGALGAEARRGVQATAVLEVLVDVGGDAPGQARVERGEDLAGTVVLPGEQGAADAASAPRRVDRRGDEHA